MSFTWVDFDCSVSVLPSFVDVPEVHRFFSILPYVLRVDYYPDSIGFYTCCDTEQDRRRFEKIVQDCHTFVLGIVQGACP